MFRAIGALREDEREVFDPVCIPRVTRPDA
jgi:hypothetical protein